MLDLRNRPIKYKDGKRVLHQPVKEIIKCFDVTTVEFDKVEKTFDEMESDLLTHLRTFTRQQN